MGWDSCDVVRFDIEPLHQGQMSTANLKALINRLLLIQEVSNVKSNLGYHELGISYVVRFDLWLLLK